MCARSCPTTGRPPRWTPCRSSSTSPRRCRTRWPASRPVHVRAALAAPPDGHPDGPGRAGPALGVTSAASSGVVDRLVARGHATRRPHHDDGRRTEVVITESGSCRGLRPVGTDVRGLGRSSTPRCPTTSGSSSSATCAAPPPRCAPSCERPPPHRVPRPRHGCSTAPSCPASAGSATPCAVASRPGRQTLGPDPGGSARRGHRRLVRPGPTHGTGPGRAGRHGPPRRARRGPRWPGRPRGRRRPVGRARPGSGSATSPTSASVRASAATFRASGLPLRALVHNAGALPETAHRRPRRATR